MSSVSIFGKMILMDTRICTKCQAEKDIDQFYNDKQKKRTGKNPVCKECDKKRSAEWARNNKENRRFIILKYKYGVTRQSYEQMLQRQEGSCAICGVKDGTFPYRLNVDHCHTTGEFRGLLCNQCNQGIGYFKESSELLENASKYISGWKNQRQKS